MSTPVHPMVTRCPCWSRLGRSKLWPVFVCRLRKACRLQLVFIGRHFVDHFRKTENTHTHPFNGPLSGTTRVSGSQKGKTNLDFTVARDSEWQWHQLSHMQVCTFLQTDNHTSTPPLSFLQAGCPSCRPTDSVKALKPKFPIPRTENRDEFSASALKDAEHLTINQLSCVFAHNFTKY